MIAVFNIGIILMVLLIAYWWANQGVFSAILHLLSVIAAGAIAFGLWEILVVKFLLTGGWFDQYAWGVTLVGVFAVALFILRLAADKLAPGNVDLAPWANLVFGFPIGLFAGVLTMGILIIGVGFLQSTSAIMGYRGYGRSQQGVVEKFTPTMWMPVHDMTAGFYGWLGATSMWTPNHLRHTNPRVHWQASLLRDSYGDGRGQIAIQPDEVVIRGHFLDSTRNEAAVQIEFQAGAMDFGDQLTLSASQVRLIADASGRDTAAVAHPYKWLGDDQKLYFFDSPTHYVTSTPARESANITLFFNRLPPGFVPKFIQVKGTRFRLPAPQAPPAGLMSGVPTAAATNNPPPPVGGRPIPTEEIRVANDIRPIRMSKNSMPGGLSETDNYLTEGVGEIRGAPTQVSRKLQIQGIYEPPGTRIVQLTAGRGHVCDLSPLRQTLPADSHVALVDSQGNTYSPLGYLWRKSDGSTTIELRPGRFLRRLDEIPVLPSSGGDEFKLYFRVTEQVTIVALKVGDTVVGSTNILVPVQ